MSAWSGSLKQTDYYIGRFVGPGDYQWTAVNVGDCIGGNVQVNFCEDARPYCEDARPY
jgi:hypothetical protein